MKKHDKILKRYLTVLILTGCAFGLLIGVTQAANKTSNLTRGTAEEIITKDDVDDYVVKRFADVFTAVLEYKNK